MLTFFNSHFPSRILFLFILICGIITGYCVFNFTFSDTILRWIIEGEKISNGNLSYRDLWTKTAPFYTLVEPILSALGRNIYLFIIVGSLLVFFQAFYFSQIINKYKLFHTKSYLPGLIYIIFSAIHLEFIGLTPEVLGITFVLFAFNQLLSINSKEKYNNTVLNVGILLGISILCSSVFTYLIILFFIGITYFSTVNFRIIILFILGILLPIMIVTTFFIALDGFNNFYSFFIVHFFEIQNEDVLNYQILYRILMVPLTFLLLGLFSAFSNSNTSNFISKVKQLFFIWFMLSIGYLLLNIQNINLSKIAILSPIISFYISFLLIYMRKKSFASFLLYVYSIGSLSAGFYYHNSTYQNKLGNNTHLIDEKRYFIVGANISEYRTKNYGTSLTNPELYLSIFQQDSKLNSIKIYKAFLIDTPDIVLDNKEGLFEKAMDNIPILKEKYYSTQKGIYHLKKIKKPL